MINSRCSFLPLNLGPVIDGSWIGKYWQFIFVFGSIYLLAAPLLDEGISLYRLCSWPILDTADKAA